MVLYEIAACPVCGGQQVRTLADRAEIERQLASLWEFHTRRLHAGAPLHQLFDRAIFSQQPPLSVVQCTECGTVFRSPRELEAEVVATYAEETPSQSALSSLYDAQVEFYRPRVRKLTSMQGGDPGSVLEVGSYLGAFLKEAESAGWAARGIDVNEAANKFAREHGAQVTSHTLESMDPGQVFDAVALWNCFDQLPDPRSALMHARSFLRTDGIVAIRVPNGACYARFARQRNAMARALLAWNNLASFPYRQGFTPDSLTRFLTDHGFVIEDVVLDTLVPISGEWTRGWARWEERIVKALQRAVRTRELAPWFEIYARKAGS